MVEREGQLITFTCDECGVETQIVSRSFKDAWEAKKESGWVAFFDDMECEWRHRCEDCRGL